MSRTYHHGGVITRKPNVRPRYRKLGRAVICLTQAQQEIEAKQLHPKKAPKRVVRE